MSFEETIRHLLRDELARFEERLKRIEDKLTTTSGNETYLSPADAARVARVTPAMIRSLIAAGKLGRYRAGRGLRVKASELEAYMAGRDITAPTDHELDDKAISIVARLGGR